jgi:plasmid stabilization system protein ParE
VVWLWTAKADLLEARAHYGGIQHELGERFASAVVETAEAIVAMPLRFAVVDKGRRRARVRRFPCDLFFRMGNTRIIVVACFHEKAT